MIHSSIVNTSHLSTASAASEHSKHAVPEHTTRCTRAHHMPYLSTVNMPYLSTANKEKIWEKLTLKSNEDSANPKKKIWKMHKVNSSRIHFNYIRTKLDGILKSRHRLFEQIDHFNMAYPPENVLFVENNE